MEIMEFYSLIKANLVWPDHIFAQGHYRFQYKLPAQKGSNWENLQGLLGFYIYECVDY